MTPPTRRAARPLSTLALAGAAAALATTAGGVAWGYAIEVHKDFYDLAWGDRDAGASVAAAAPADLEALRRFVWERGQRFAEFRRRWPTPEAFDAAAFKELLGLDPAKVVVAVDHAAPGRPLDVRTVVREGSVDPDNDRRNQDRLFAPGGQVLLDAFGRAVPYDPRTVWFGGLTGTPSQFDAHGATLRTGDKGGGVMTAFRHPEQFARPPVALGSAPEFSQRYADLAMIARLRGGPGAAWQERTWFGASLHGLEDLGNQIHCTVLGIPEFFVDAKLTQLKAKLRRILARRHETPAAFAPPATLTTAQVAAALAEVRAGRTEQVDPQVRFALGLEPKGTPSDVELGIQIIGNHHRLLEDFVERQVIRGLDDLAAGRPMDVPPAVRAVLDRARRGDDDFERACRDRLAAAGLGTAPRGATPALRLVCEALVERSAPEAAPIYRAIRKLSLPGLKREQVYDADRGHDPMKHVTATSGEHVDRIWDLSGRAFARVVTGLRLWDEVFARETGGVAPGSPEALDRAGAIADRLIEGQLAYLAEAAARRDAYLAEKLAEKAEADAPRRGLMSRLRGLFGGAPR